MKKEANFQIYICVRVVLDTFFNLAALLVQLANGTAASVCVNNSSICTMTILAQLNDCHCCNDARSIVQKRLLCFE